MLRIWIDTSVTVTGAPHAEIDTQAEEYTFAGSMITILGLGT